MAYLFSIEIFTCGWRAALTWTKWKKVGSALFWYSVNICRQNKHQKIISSLEFRIPSWRTRPILPYGPDQSCMLASSFEVQWWNFFFHPNFVLMWVKIFKKMHSQLCSILLGLGQPTSHMWFSYLVKRKRSNWHVKAYVKLRPTNPGFTVSRYIIENSEEKMIRRLKAE